MEEIWKLSETPDQAILHNKIRPLVDRVRAVPGVNHISDAIYWRYYTFLHLCGTDTIYSGEKHLEYLKMMDGEFFDMKTVDEMESPLMAKIVELKQQLQREKPAKFVAMERRITNIIKRMQVKRISSHGKKGKNVIVRKKKTRRPAASTIAAESSTAADEQ